MDIAALSRLVENLIRIGTISAVDHAAARCRVASGELESEWLPWLEQRAGDTRTWEPPTVGEQVILLSPSGEPAGGIVLTGIFRSAHPAPSGSASAHLIDYPDGARVSYDHAAHTWLLDVPVGGSITLHIGRTTFVLSDSGVALDTPALDITEAG